MKANYDASLALVLRSEGGWSNNPADPGGATMKGVIQRTYDAYRTNHGLLKQTVRNISDAELAAIYHQQYADAVRFDDLPAGVDYATFDYAVNSGPARAANELQRVVGAAVDGHIGEVTIAACRKMNEVVTVNALCDRRLAFLRGLKTWRTFGKGWLSRVAAVRADAKRMATTASGATPQIPKPPDVQAPAPTPKAPQSDWSWLSALVNIFLALFKKG